MNANNLEFFLNSQQLVPLKILSNWLVVKNYLYNINLDWLNNLNEDDKFQMSEIYLYKNIFYAKFDRKINNLAYSFVVDISIYPEVDGETYKSFEYELGLGLYEVSKKNRLVVMKTYTLNNILDVAFFLNLIFLDVYHKLDDYVADGNNDLFVNIENFIRNKTS